MSRKWIACTWLFWILTPLVVAETKDSYPAVVVDTQALGTDLEVRIRWTADDAAFSTNWAEVHLLDSEGEVVATTIAFSAPGDTTTHMLESGLDQVGDRGFQYEVEVVAPAGGRLAPVYPVRITLNCSGDDECWYQTISGIYSNVVAVSHELLAALDGQAADQSMDLLQGTLTTAPHLRGEIHDLAAQLDSLWPASTGSSCQCLWFAAYTLVPSEARAVREFLTTNSNEFIARRDESGPGAQVFMGAQTEGEAEFIEYTGSTGLGLHQRCYRVTGWNLPVGQEDVERHRSPVLEPCEDLCMPSEITASAAGSGLISAQAWSGNGHAKSTVEANAYVLFPTQSDFPDCEKDADRCSEEIVALSYWPNDPASVHDDERLVDFSLDEIITNREGADVFVQVAASIDLETQFFGECASSQYCLPWAFGTAWFGNWDGMAITGESSCTISGATATIALPAITGNGLIIRKARP